MTAIDLLIWLVVIGIVYYCVNRFLGPYMGAPILKIFNIVIVIIAVLVVLNFFGVIAYLRGMKSPV